MIQAFGLTSTARKAHPPAVCDVSFEARAGRVTALLGAAGAGKTTALRLMLELQQGRGITHFRGRPLHGIPHPSREVGVVLGDVPGHPARSVRGHLRMLCAAAGVSARRADEVLEVVGLVSLREERLGTLARGMDRRLGLACALLPDPHTLVLDEPTGGLSAREARWLHGMMRAHAAQGGTVLFTTADSKEAARTSDRVVTLDDGRLVADQEADEFARTRLRPRVAVRSPHAARLAALLAKEARTAQRSVEVVREGGNRLSVYGSTTADIGETAFRHGILVHQLADEVGDMGPGADAESGGETGTAGEVVTTGQERGAPDSVPGEWSRSAPGSLSGECDSDSGQGAPRDADEEQGCAVSGASVREPEQDLGGERSSLGQTHGHQSVPDGAETADGMPVAGESQADTASDTASDIARETDRSSADTVSLADTSADTASLTDAADGDGGASLDDLPVIATGWRPAAAAPGTGPSGAGADPEPQSGATRTAVGARAVGATVPGARIPDARNAGSRQPQAGQPSRPEAAHALDDLSPLPPPISVRPAHSPLRPLRYELRRATGIGVGFLTCGAVLVLSALTAVVLARIGHTPQARLFAAWPRGLPLPPAALGAGLLGALAFGDEFRHPALAADRGTVPRRLGLLTAKLLVSGATAVTLAFLTVGCDAEMLYLVYGRELTQVPSDWLSLSVSWFGLVISCAWAGVLAAGVFRSTTAGLAAVLAVPVVVVPVVHQVLQGQAVPIAAGLSLRMRELFLLQWPFGGERYLLGVARVVAQPVGGAMTLSLAALLCAYVLTTLRTRAR
ncbi:ATP-binding cassette domain-containing protein [Streptomyces sp. NPDC020362]|uniref:ATP-binding cassette domain-containing protein n=1 Tax=unclassified Streptomyces TaxID=2593676 RepID=UPI0033CA80E3